MLKKQTLILDQKLTGHLKPVSGTCVCFIDLEKQRAWVKHENTSKVYHGNLLREHIQVTYFNLKSLKMTIHSVFFFFNPVVHQSHVKSSNLAIPPMKLQTGIITVW